MEWCVVVAASAPAPSCAATTQPVGIHCDYISGAFYYYFPANSVPTFTCRSVGGGGEPNIGISIENRTI